MGILKDGDGHTADVTGLKKAIIFLQIRKNLSYVSEKKAQTLPIVSLIAYRGLKNILNFIENPLASLVIHIFQPGCYYRKKLTSVSIFAVPYTLLVYFSSR